LAHQCLDVVGRHRGEFFGGEVGQAEVFHGSSFEWVCTDDEADARKSTMLWESL
jgi:hypothetical protein